MGFRGSSSPLGENVPYQTDLINYQIQSVKKLNKEAQRLFRIYQSD
jgi:hypothetical protein